MEMISILWRMINGKGETRESTDSGGEEPREFYMFW